MLGVTIAAWCVGCVRSHAAWAWRILGLLPLPRLHILGSPHHSPPLTSAISIFIPESHAAKYAFLYCCDCAFNDELKGRKQGEGKKRCRWLCLRPGTDAHSQRQSYKARKSGPGHLQARRRRALQPQANPNHSKNINIIVDGRASSAFLLNRARLLTTNIFSYHLNSHFILHLILDILS